MALKILVLNCGSSSVKYKVLEVSARRAEAIVGGVVERVGTPQVTHRIERADGRPETLDGRPNDYRGAIEWAVRVALEHEGQIDAVGHRVVHAGEKFRGSVRVTREVVAALEECSELAPLHNPPNLAGIAVAQTLLAEAVHVAVFDNALHHAFDPWVYTYALPLEYYRKYRVRRYGFHGVAFRSAYEEAGRLLRRNLNRLRVITLMLGSGCTANARLKGRSVEVSTGFTPLEGLVQSTRSGDVDPAAVLYLMQKEALTPGQASDMLNKRSGLLGISEVSADLRDIQKAAKTRESARLALQVFVHRARKYLGAYAAVLGGVDVVIFAGGIGERAADLRWGICERMEYMGLRLSRAANAAAGGEAVISAPSSKVVVVVVRVDEERVIARDCYQIMSRGLERLEPE
jgi:acetate kinase